MKLTGILVISGILLASISFGSVAKSGKVYTWTDSKGVVHYGERPPKDAQAKLVKTRTGHSDPTPAPTSNAPAVNNSSEAPAARPAKNSERCQQATENLNLLNSAARIRTQNTDGAAVYMTEDDKAKQRLIMEEVIAQECD